MAARKTSSKAGSRKKPAASRGKTRKVQAKPRSRAAVSKPPSQHGGDIWGLLLIASSVLIAYVLWFGGRGGTVGDAAGEALLALAGHGAFLAPVALLCGGVLLIGRHVFNFETRQKVGSVALGAGCLLGLAAGTLGAGARYPVRTELFNREYFEAHGGLVGDALFGATSTLFSVLGAHLLAVVLLAVGAMLVSGTSLATAVNVFKLGVDRARGKAPRGDKEAHTLAGRVVGTTDAAFVPPEPDGVEPIVRATHIAVTPAGSNGDQDFDLGHATDLLERADGTADTAEQDQLDVGRKLIRPSRDLLDATVDELGSSVPLVPGKSESKSKPKVSSDRRRGSYHLPAPKLLLRSKGSDRPDTAGQEKTASQLVQALGHFGVDAKLVGTVAGPHVTRYELQLAPGIKVGKVAQLKDDLAYALASTDIRILAPIPGKQAVGVEVPNTNRLTVHLGDIYQPLPADWSPLGVWLGKDIAGKAIGTDLAKMPHILVAGTTGSGKSGCINAMLSSILLRATPDDCKLVLVDPKQVELNHYDGIPHLLTPVVTSPRMAANVLANLIREMEQRYTLMNAVRTRNIIELNKQREKEGLDRLPYILCVIDELADLMMVAPAEVEDAIIRLAQKSRAVGIHLLLATQRPSADIITGMIKANVPSRIAFAVSSQTDSRVVLDQNGAESLLGQGDMLFSPIGTSRMQRIQGAYITEEEIAQITDCWRDQGEPDFHDELLDAPEESGEAGGGGLNADHDDMLAEAMTLVVQMGTASTSMLQRRLRVGYTRAGRLIDMLERRGVVSGYEGSKARQVLVSEGELPRLVSLLSDDHLPPDERGDQSKTVLSAVGSDHVPER